MHQLQRDESLARPRGRDDMAVVSTALVDLVELLRGQLVKAKHRRLVPLSELSAIQPQEKLPTQPRPAELGEGMREALLKLARQEGVTKLLQVGDVRDGQAEHAAGIVSRVNRHDVVANLQARADSGIDDRHRKEIEEAGRLAAQRGEELDIDVCAAPIRP